MTKFTLGTWELEHSDGTTTEIHVHTQTEARFIYHNFHALKLTGFNCLEATDGLTGVHDVK
jgi:hypothetical protein